MRSPKSRHSRGWLGPVTTVFLVIMAGYWAAAAFVIGVDPLDIYPWGKPVTRGAGSTAEAHEDLLAAIVRDPSVDLLLVGGSTTAGYTEGQLRDWMPGLTRNPANLSYYSPRTGDQEMLLDLIEKHSYARHIIITYHISYTEPRGGMRSGFPVHLLDDDWLNDLQLVSPHSVSLAGDVLAGRPPYGDSPVQRSEDQRREDKYRDFQTAAAMDDLAGRLERGQPTLTGPAPRSCSAYPAVTDVLVPFARRMARRGVRVDIMMPAYSVAMYGNWATMPDVLGRYPANFMERDLAARRCVVTLLDDTPGVKVVAFENEEWITGDMGRYRDPVHLHDPEAAGFMFQNLDNPAFRLTRTNVDPYLATLRDRALSYKPFNSVLGYGDDR
ncbi:hypothetical protein [Brevundimonas sp. A19_0]|uniref:hypothetical protein n=1 Tax=Brevundimonas sp. A19_0 TaxID=2821087 RepID=UPI001ADA0880|nr:hypothetical protein [Brevundimonas sp. A19_0]MBO9500287.1 hypothetical protein [Brevundimonas sp. A19_0]